MNRRNVDLHEDVAASLGALCAKADRPLDDVVNAILRSHLTHVASHPSGATVQNLLYGASRLRLIEDTLTAIVDAVIKVDQHGAVDFMNPAAEELTGWQCDDALGRPVAAVLQISSPDADWLANDLVQTCLQQGERIDVQDDAILVNRAGREISVDGVASPLRNESGNIVGAALMLRDITARRLAERELTAQRNKLEQLVAKRTADLKALQDELLKKERLATLGHLTATVSHEIRNPLGTIRNSVHVLEERVRGKVMGVEGLFDRIDRNVKRCTAIISELLEFAQVRDLRYEPTDIDRWLASLVEEMEIASTVHVETELTFGRHLDVDRERLRSAVMNVCDNACQAMLEDEPSRERRLTIRTRALAGKLELSVTDTGPGMTDEVREQIFRELFSTKRFGVGLGLPIVKRIVEQHGGEIHVQSTPGAGTRVTMRIPARTP